MNNFRLKEREERILIKKTAATLATFGLVFSLFGFDSEAKAQTVEGELACEDSRFLDSNDSVVIADQGETQGGALVQEARSDINAIFGAANGDGSANTGFYSLGFGGKIVIKLGAPMYVEEGSFIRLHEVTNGIETYPEEKAVVYVSEDGDSWDKVGETTNKDSGEVYLNDFEGEVVNFIKITDTTDEGQVFPGDDSGIDGYDLDAVEVKSCEFVPDNKDIDNEEKGETGGDDNGDEESGEVEGGNGGGNDGGDGSDETESTDEGENNPEETESTETPKGDDPEETLTENPEEPVVTSTRKRGGRVGGSSGVVTSNTPEVNEDLEEVTPAPQVLGEATEAVQEPQETPEPIGQVLGDEDFPGMPNAGYLPLMEDYAKLATIFGALLLIPAAIVGRRKFKNTK